MTTLDPPHNSVDPGLPPRFDRTLVIGLLVFASRFLTLLPIAVAVLLAVTSPTYFGPMFSTPVGVGLLVAGTFAIAGGYGLSEVGARLARREGARLAWGLVLICAVWLLQFFVLWIVLLGPAIVILSQQR